MLARMRIHMAFLEGNMEIIMHPHLKSVPSLTLQLGAQEPVLRIPSLRIPINLCLLPLRISAY